MYSLFLPLSFFKSFHSISFLFSHMQSLSPPFSLLSLSLSLPFFLSLSIQNYYLSQHSVIFLFHFFLDAIHFLDCFPISLFIFSLHSTFFSTYAQLCLHFTLLPLTRSFFSSPSSSFLYSNVSTQLPLFLSSSPSTLYLSPSSFLFHLLSVHKPPSKSLVSRLGLSKLPSHFSFSPNFSLEL